MHSRDTAILNFYCDLMSCTIFQFTMVPALFCKLLILCTWGRIYQEGASAFSKLPLSHTWLVKYPCLLVLQLLRRAWLKGTIETCIANQYFLSYTQVDLSIQIREFISEFGCHRNNRGSCFAKRQTGTLDALEDSVVRNFISVDKESDLSE